MWTIECFSSEGDWLFHRITRHEKVRVLTSNACVFLVQYQRRHRLFPFIVFVFRQQIFLLRFVSTFVTNHTLPESTLLFSRIHIRYLLQMLFAKQRAANLFF